jgi:hypothetical protein
MIKVNITGPDWPSKRKWLCEHVGKQGVDWDYLILVCESDQLIFEREADETAFRLRWM